MSSYSFFLLILVEKKHKCVRVCGTFNFLVFLCLNLSRKLEKMYIVNLTTACSHSPSFSSLEAINLNIAKSLNVNACNKKCSRHTHKNVRSFVTKREKRFFGKITTQNYFLLLGSCGLD